ncbi:MAG: glycosyltransferase family 4 protein [Candidatus Omnitrophica bacterium]|nr:glycosyltransferase family 4 protein [Candidatus Omnitrophota bacterium]
MSKIKVAQVITRLDWCGAPDIYRILSAGLDPDAFDITLIAGPSVHPTKKTLEFLAEFQSRVRIIPGLKREIDLPADLSAFLSLWNIFRRERFDVVHTHTAKAGALGRLAARLSGVSVIVHTPHGHNLYGYFNQKMTRRIIMAESYLSTFTDKIIALTELEKRDYLKSKVAREDKVAVIYQGLELDKYACDWKDKVVLKRSFNINAGEDVIGMVGRLETVKGPGYFIEMAAKVISKFPKTKFIIAGEGSLRAALEEKTGRLGIRGNVIFAGWRDDIPEILSILDVLVMPSLNEAVGISAIEAQAEGVSVVASRVGGIPEIVQDRVTGLLVNPTDPDALAEAVTELISDKDKRVRMGRSGKLWVRGKFAAGEMIDKISSLYAELSNKKKYGIL